MAGVFFAIAGFFLIGIGIVLENCSKNPFVNEDYSWKDYLPIAIALLGFATVFHQGWDMSLSMKHSKDMLKMLISGNTDGFYTYTLNRALSGAYGGLGIKDAAFYNIFIYIILLVIMLPYWGVEYITKMDFPENIALTYLSIILILFLLYSAYILYKTTLLITESKIISKRTVYIYLSSYLLMYSTVGFCQMDIIFVIVMQMAILYYLKGSLFKFSMLMSVAIMLKSFPVIVFVPLLLLVEKRIIEIIKYAVLCGSFPVFSRVITMWDEGYSTTQAQMKELYGFTDRLFANGLNTGVGFAAFFIVSIVLLCIWCFDKDIKDDDRWRYAIIVPIIAFSSFFILVLWHPQWFAMLVPFLSISLGICANRRSLIYCEWGIGVVVSLLCFIFLQGNVDNYMLNYGLLPVITGQRYTGVSLGSIFQLLIDNHFRTFATSLLVAMLLYSCYFISRDIYHMNKPNEFEKVSVSRGLIMARTVSAYMFTILLVSTFFFD